MKKPALVAITGLLGFLIMSLLAAPVSAQTVTVPALEIGRLGPYNGQYLTVYYGVGNKAAISTAKDQLTLREVKAKKTLRISGNSASLPEVTLKREGITMAYNLIVLVVHGSEPFSWKNANGTLPKGEVAQGAGAPIAVDALTKSELDARTAEGGAKVKIEFSVSN